MKKYLITLLSVFLLTSTICAAPWRITNGQVVSISFQGSSAVENTALEILEKDLCNVLDAQVQLCDASQADIVIRTVGKGPREGFSIEVPRRRKTPTWMSTQPTVTWAVWVSLHP